MKITRARAGRLVAVATLAVSGALGGAAPIAAAAPTASTVPPYHRDAFGDGWRQVNRWCDTRDTILARDLTATTTSHGCNVLTGTLHDPYSGRTFVGSTRVLDIDHRVPLAYAWAHGAWRWTAARRVSFANDPANLQTTTASINRAKGDKGLGQWLPAQGRCAYARTFDQVADRYGLTDPSRNAAVTRACR